MGRLGDAFLGARAPGADPGRDDLEARLAAALEEARLGWPGVAVGAEAFAAFLGARVDDLGAAPVADLYLACACAAGDPRALAAFERDLLPEVDVAVGRARGGDTVRDEVRQVVRKLLFVAPEGSAPGIAGFQGRGSLRGWLRIVAAREVQRLLKRQKREVLVDDDALLDRLSPGGDLELEQLKAESRNALAAAFRATVASLTPRQRTLLRYQVVDGLSIDEICAIHRCHRATAARWLVKARDALVAGTKARLLEKLKLGTRDLDSLVGLVRSRLDLSLERVLRA